MNNQEDEKLDLPKGLQIGVLDNVNLQLLVEFGRETNRVDYKLTFSASNKRTCHEFSKDISAFANIGGGYMVIGVEPATNKPIGITPEVERDLDPTKISQAVSKYITPAITLQTYPGDYKEDDKNIRLGLIYICGFKKRPHFINGTYSYRDERQGVDIISLREGTVYVRRQSASKPIDADSWEELLERFYDKMQKKRKGRDYDNQELLSLEREEFFRKAGKYLKNG